MPQGLEPARQRGGELRIDTAGAGRWSSAPRGAGLGRGEVEPLQGLEALVDLAERDLDGSQAVVHATQVVADIENVAKVSHV